MVPNHFSTTNNLIQGVEEFIKTYGVLNHRTPEAQISPLDTGRTGTLHVIHRLDESSNSSESITVADTGFYRGRFHYTIAREERAKNL